MKKLSLIVLVVAVYVLHQDFWNWKNAGVVLGFLPAGLAYHAGYSILAAVMMALLVQFAWPTHLEQAEPHDSDGKDHSGDSHG